jgi:hypothetical protein
VTVVVRRPGPPLGGLVRAITYQAGEQPRASVEKILPGPGASLWVNLNQDEFRSFSHAGRVVRVPGAMLAGPTGRASVIEFEQGRAHVSVTFTLGAAACFFAPPLRSARDQQLPLADLWGRSGAGLRERLLEAATPQDALDVMEDVLREQMTGPLAPDPMVTAAGGALSAGVAVGEVAEALGVLPRTLRRRFTAQVGLTPKRFARYSGCSGWFGILTGGSRSTGRPWPRGMVTPTSRTSPGSSGNSWASPRPDTCGPGSTVPITFGSTWADGGRDLQADRQAWLTQHPHPASGLPGVSPVRSLPGPRTVCP